MRTALAVTPALVIALSFAACEDQDKVRISELERQLEASQTEVTQMRTEIADSETLQRENEELRAELETVRARIGELEQPGGAGVAGADGAALSEPLANSIAALQPPTIS